MQIKLDVVKHDIHIGLIKTAPWYFWTLVIDAEVPLIATFSTRPTERVSSKAVAMLFKWRLRPPNVDMAMDIMKMREEARAKKNTPVTMTLPGMEEKHWDSYKLVKANK